MSDFEAWVRDRETAVRARMPVQYTDCHVEHQEIRDWCSRVLTGHGSSLLLQGPKGTGKTGNAWAAWPHLIRLGWVGSWKATTEVDYLDGLLSDKTTAGAFRRCQVLLLDDVGTASVSDWSRSRVFALIDARWLSGLPTILTTNLTAAQLAQHLGDRAASRLAAEATVLTMPGADRRLA